MSTQKAPKTLGEAGLALWREITTEYQLRADELRNLESACGASDMLAEFTKQWHDLGRPTISKGSTGQEVEHPLISSIDKQRKSLRDFLKSLNLPDEAPAGKQNANRSAAQSRWAAHSGSVA